MQGSLLNTGATGNAAKQTMPLFNGRPDPAFAEALAKVSPQAQAKAKATATDFEAMFLNSMFAHMTSGIKGDGPFGDTPGRLALDAYRTIFEIVRQGRRPRIFKRRLSHADSSTSWPGQLAQGNPDDETARTARRARPDPISIDAKRSAQARGRSNGSDERVACGDRARNRTGARGPAARGDGAGS